MGHCLRFSSQLSKPVAFQQSSVPKLLVAGLPTLFVMFEGQQKGRTLDLARALKGLHRGSIGQKNMRFLFFGTSKISLNLAPIN